MTLFFASLLGIPYNAKWTPDALTVAGEFGPGPTFNRFHCPMGLWVVQNETVFIADTLNHRIMKYRFGKKSAQRLAGKNLREYRNDLLAGLTDIAFDKSSNSLIICDYHNRRVLQWFPKNEEYEKVLIRNIECFGVALDDKGFFYISDTENHQVKRYKIGKRRGVVVAGGNEQGHQLQQLNHPTYICIAGDQTVYVSDSWNDRVVRWDKGAETGVIVAGGNGKGKNRNQLDHPTGILVDQSGTVYVADYWNNRIMRWYNGAKEGTIIAGDRFRSGECKTQLAGPEVIAFDQCGNLFVTDSDNHRIQRFDIYLT